MSEAADPTPAEPGAPSEEEQAWERVVASWADEEVHRAYLARFTDFDGYAVAGARYRAVLAERPEDPTALRMRDEVVRRATVYGLASLPRTRPSRLSTLPRWVRILVVLALLMATLFLVGLAAGLVRDLLRTAP